MAEPTSKEDSAPRNYTGLSGVVEVRAASFVKDSATGKQTVEVVMATNTPVRRQRWRIGPGGEDIYVYDEVLECTDETVDRTYLSQGMSVCDTHNAMSVFGVFGSVIPDSVRFENGQMIGTIEFNDFGIDSGLAAAVEKKQIRFLSLSYEFTQPVWDMSKDIPVLRGRIMPLEVSFVGIPADVNSQVRSKISAAMRRSKQETKTMPTEAEIKAARDLLASVETAEDKAKREKDEADLAAARKLLADKEAAEKAEAEAKALAEARAKAPVSVTDPAYVQILTAARTLKIEAAVEAAQAIGGSIDDVREAAKAALRSRKQPTIDTNLSTQTEEPETTQVSDARSMENINSLDILAKIKAHKAASRK